VEHADLPALSPCEQQIIPMSRQGTRLVVHRPREKAAGTTISAINAAGGALVDQAAMTQVLDAVLRCTEYTGLIGARIAAGLERGPVFGGPFDLWIIVEVPMPGGRASSSLPQGLLPLPTGGGS
jgi:hypothetical protein